MGISCEFGFVFRPRRGASKITVSRSPVAPPEITYPAGMSRAAVRSAIGFLYKEFTSRLREPVENPIMSGYRTRLYIFSFVEASGTKLSATLTDKEVYIFVPRGEKSNSYPVQFFTFSVLKDVLRAEARALIPTMVSHEAARFDLEYGTVTIKDVKTRWGSCSSLKNLNFSLFSMLLPDDLLRYLILHELAHLRYLNHGDAFWDFLTEMLGEDSQAFAHRLRMFKLDVPNLF